LSSNYAREADTAPAAQTLERLFNDLFAQAEQTLLCGGAEEPLYTPARGPAPALIHYRHDYPASALHEVAHWCIAGARRRKLVDYGYWYAPDGRDARQQREFIQLEARPQALEWFFSLACGLRFRPSLDNLEAPPDAQLEGEFAARIAGAAAQLREQGLPPRAASFTKRLGAHFGTEGTLAAAQFSAAELS